MIINCDLTDCRVCNFHHCGLHDYNKAVEEYSRPKGKWIKGDMFECDQCHHRMIVGDGAYNYCPHCGASMEMESEE